MFANNGTNSSTFGGFFVPKQGKLHGFVVQAFNGHFAAIAVADDNVGNALLHGRFGFKFPGVGARPHRRGAGGGVARGRECNGKVFKEFGDIYSIYYYPIGGR